MLRLNLTLICFSSEPLMCLEKISKNCCLLLLQIALILDFKAPSGAEGAVNASREL